MLKNIKPNASREFGFGKTEDRQRRLLNRDGTYNTRRIGLAWYKRFSFYHFLIRVSWIKFIILVFFFYTSLNICFTALYFFIGIEQLSGLIYTNELEKFMEVYLHSAQTLTTVGYGRISPTGIWANLISSFEALLGLMTFALVTGLLYGRFSKPVPYIMFSEKGLIAPYKDTYAFMFRMVNKMNNNLMSMNIKVNLGISETQEDGSIRRSFYPLNLERDEIVFFPTSWTVVHPIDENSPLFGLTKDDFEQAHPEFFMLLTGFDDTFDHTIHVRTSYALEDIIWGARFEKMLNIDDDGYQYVDLSKLSSYTLVN
jgi:inward rectifier potassium channel